MADGIDFALLAWAGSYDGYQRIAGDGKRIHDVLRPVREALEETGEVPAWAGVDLLRGYAFVMVRADRHAGGGTLGRNFLAVVDAIDRHPATRPGERPPRRHRAPEDCDQDEDQYQDEAVF